MKPSGSRGSHSTITKVSRSTHSLSLEVLVTCYIYSIWTPRDRKVQWFQPVLGNRFNLSIVVTGSTRKDMATKLQTGSLLRTKGARRYDRMVKVPLIVRTFGKIGSVHRTWGKLYRD